ncbi:MAG: uncharacterized protein QOD75_3326 [Blastocatellia bacterium]|jgi:uncharacterized protein YggE|nr:uncharacterized protein [Blastocatellia bacterium]
MRNPVWKLSAIIALIFSASMIALADDKIDPPLITVTGEAEVNVIPDEVVFDVTVQTLNRDLRQAKTQTDEKLKTLIALTRKYGIAAEDVQTDYIKLEPRYRGNDEARTFLGYSVRKDLVFTLRDVTKAEGLLSDILEPGVTRLNSVRFQTSQLRKYRDQARTSAITAAREKALALTATIGQTIGKAYSIEEDVPQRGYAVQNTSNFISTEAGDATSSEGTLALGRIKITARVTVRFELR